VLIKEFILFYHARALFYADATAHAKQTASQKCYTSVKLSGRYPEHGGRLDHERRDMSENCEMATER